MILNPAARVRILSGGQYTIRLRSLHRAYPSLHPFGVVHWVPEQLNIKAVTGACKLIDGCSLELCSATPSVALSGICHRNIVNSIAWLYRDGLAEIVSVTLHYMMTMTTTTMARMIKIINVFFIAPYIRLGCTWFPIIHVCYAKYGYRLSYTVV